MNSATQSIVVCCLLLIATSAYCADDPIRDTYPEEQKAVKAALDRIWESAGAGDVEGLADGHLDSEKFSKWEDFTDVLLDYETTVAYETSVWSQVTRFEYEIVDLRIDVFGPVAIAAFVIPYELDLGEETIVGEERGTLVFAKDDGAWKIAHEHFSPVMREDQAE